MIFFEGEDHHFHVGTRLVTTKASVTNIIRLEQTFPQVHGGRPGRAWGGGWRGLRGQLREKRGICEGLWSGGNVLEWVLSCSHCPSLPPSHVIC